MSIDTHWACFDCRKSFRYLPSSGDGSNESRSCPECDGVMCEMGRYFEPPRRRDRRAWATVELLAQNGFRFWTEGSRAFIHAFVLMDRRPRFDAVAGRLSQQRAEQEEMQIRKRLRRHKERKREPPAS